MINEPIVVSPVSGVTSVFKAGVYVGGIGVLAILALIAVAVSSDSDPA